MLYKYNSDMRIIKVRSVLNFWNNEPGTFFRKLKRNPAKKFERENLKLRRFHEKLCKVGVLYKPQNSFHITG